MLLKKRGRSICFERVVVGGVVGVCLKIKGGRWYFWPRMVVGVLLQRGGSLVFWNERGCLFFFFFDKQGLMVFLQKRGGWWVVRFFK